jgi:hypothetical protein
MWLFPAAIAATVTVSQPTHQHLTGAGQVLAEIQTPWGEQWLGRMASWPLGFAVGDETGIRHHITPIRLGTVDFVAAGDYTGDGFDDLLLADRHQYYVVDGETGFVVGAGAAGAHMILADLDGDGRVEIIGDMCGGALCVVYQGRNRWISPFIVRSTAIAAAQADADPSLEVLVGARILDGATGAVEGTIGIPWSLRYAVGDVDGDGPDDLFYAHAGGGTVRDLRSGVDLWTGPYAVSRPRFVDVDGDGLDDVVYTAGFESSYHGATGVPLSLQPYDCRVGVIPLDLPSGLHIGCFGHGVLVDPSGQEIRVHGPPEALSMFAHDLDGDGAREVVVGNARGVRVFAGDGRGLSYQPLDHRHVSVLEGPDRMVLTQAGVAEALWQPGQGFTAGDVWLPSSTPMVSPALHDTDGDGELELVYKRGTRWTELDLATGQDRGVWLYTGHSELADLTGDAAPEVVIPSGWRQQVAVRSAGVPELLLPGERHQIVPSPSGDQLLVQTGRLVEIFDLRVAQQPHTTVQLPWFAGDAYYAYGRLWYHLVDAVVSEPLGPGHTWVFEGAEELRGPPVKTRGAVWLRTRTALERWPLP